MGGFMTISGVGGLLQHFYDGVCGPNLEDPFF